jgi:hypothetical protein
VPAADAEGAATKPVSASAAVARTAATALRRFVISFVTFRKVENPERRFFVPVYGLRRVR